MIHTDKLDRYPGIKSFEKEQYELFKGREAETSQLFNLVLMENLVVLFSKSGVGKSSLLNAGLNPMLVAEKFIPVHIRVQPTSGARHRSPVSIVKVNLEDYAEKADIPSNPRMNLENAPLWEFIKSCKFPDNSSLVLIFDQFEEFFSIETEYQDEFLQDIAEILHSEPPVRILDWYKDIPFKKRTNKHVEWCSQPRVKVIIGIREDRFGELKNLSSMIPDIMRNMFKLNPLTLKGAGEAIELPARMHNAKYSTPAFSFSNDAMNTIIGQLSGGKNYIESSQLQIVCNQIENKLKADKTLLTKERIVVTPDFFGSKQGIDEMIKNFYYRQINQLPDTVSRKNAKDLLEMKLVHNNKRVLMSEDQVQSFLIKNLRCELRMEKTDSLTESQKDELVLNMANRIISGLLELRLIRGDYREDVKLYEISHDTLLQPINKEIYLRSRKEELDKHLSLINEAKEREKQLEEEKLKAKNEKLLKEEAIKLKEKAEQAEKKTKSLLQMVEKERDRANYHKKRAYLLSMVLGVALLIFIVLFVQKMNRLSGNTRPPGSIFPVVED